MDERWKKHLIIALMCETPPIWQLTELKTNSPYFFKQVTKERESEKMLNKGDYSGGAEVDK